MDDSGIIYWSSIRIAFVILATLEISPFFNSWCLRYGKEINSSIILRINKSDVDTNRASVPSNDTFRDTCNKHCPFPLSFFSSSDGFQ